MIDNESILVYIHEIKVTRILFGAVHEESANLKLYN